MNPAPQRRLQGPPTPERRPKILLADDQPLSLMLAANELEDLCQPLLAHNGQQTLQLARKQQPALILLDVRMPDMDGFAVCRQLKADPHTRHIPIIFLTVLDEEHDEVYGLNLGAIDYISKPFSPAILRARVRNQLLSLRQRQQLEHIAQIDALTGIANRRCFDEQLQFYWQQHQASGQPLGLLMIDIDHFKTYNDSQGHTRGDLALQQVARAIAGQMLRSEDLATRYGGEEFACILPATDLDGCCQIAQRICAAVAALDISHPAASTAAHITVSLGACSRVPQPDSTPSMLVQSADRSLYRAKQNGRNRAVCQA